MKIADYLKYYQTKLSNLEHLAGTIDLSKGTAVFQSSESLKSSETPEGSDISDINAGSGSTQSSGTTATRVLTYTKVSSDTSGATGNSGSVPNACSSKSSNAADELKLAVDLNSNNLIQGLIMSEILGAPRAKKLRGNTVWNSRF